MQLLKIPCGGLLCVFLLLLGCQKPDSSIAGDESQISDAQREEYYKLAEAGIGDAYFALGFTDTEDTVATKGNGRILSGLALAKGGARANFDYAYRIFEFALKLPKGSHAREVLLDEAEKRVDVAIRNKLMFDYAIDEIVGEVYCGEDSAGDCLTKQKGFFEANKVQIDTYENLYRKIKAAQRGENVSFDALPIKPKNQSRQNDFKFLGRNAGYQ